jgi:hypothetical protein
MRFYHNESVANAGIVSTHYFISQIMYNDRARLLIHITFNCPLNQWPEKKKYAEVMLADMRLYDFDKSGEPNQASEPTAEAAVAHVAR